MSEILVVHVELEGLHPPVWRRLEIRASASFWALHCAIQDAMPWQDYHLHEFRFPAGDAETQIGIPFPELDSDLELIASWGALLKDWFPTMPGMCAYLYDFGDCWEHRITMESREEGRKGRRYPRCVGGEGRCPPEDVGGVPGFLHFKEAMADPAHEEHEEFVDWFGSVWESSVFNPKSVRFSSPKRRLREAGLG